MVPLVLTTTAICAKDMASCETRHVSLRRDATTSHLGASSGTCIRGWSRAFTPPKKAIIDCIMALLSQNSNNRFPVPKTWVPRRHKMRLLILARRQVVSRLLQALALGGVPSCLASPDRLLWIHALEACLCIYLYQKST